MLSTTLDPDGRRVILTEERWEHIKAEHPTLARRQREIMATVRELEQRLPGRTDNEAWFFDDGALPGFRLQVVVHYEGGEGWIVTAFPRELPRSR